MVKIYTEGNYLIVIIDGHTEQIIDHKSRSFIYNSSSTKYVISSPKIGEHEFDISDISDKLGNPYTVASFEAFFKFNTGFNTASGGSGATSPYKYAVDVFADLALITDMVDGDIARVYNPTGIWPFTNKNEGAYTYLSGVWEYGSRSLQSEVIQNDADILAINTEQGTQNNRLDIIESEPLVKSYVFQVDPTINDDFNDGYNIGDRWINSLEGNEFTLIDNSVGAALWKKTTELNVSGGEVIFDSNVVFEGAIALASSETFNIVGTVDNLSTPNISGTNVLRLTGSGTITGIVKPLNELNQILYLLNVSGGNIQINNNDAGSVAENRILCKNNRTMQLNEAMTIVYDDVDLRWRMTGLGI